MKKFVAILMTILMLFTLFQGASRENVVKADEVYQWVPVNNGLPGDEVGSLAIDPKNTNVIYAGIYEAYEKSSVFKSTDGGASWSQMSNGLTSTSWWYMSIFSLAIDPTNTNIIYAGTDHGVYKSTDGGASWSTINNGLRFCIGVPSLAIDPKNTNIIYAGTNGGSVFKSTNGGANWSQINNGLGYNIVESVVIDPANTNIIYVGTEYGGVFKSTNGGAKWTQTVLKDKIVFSLAIDPKNTNTIYAGMYEESGVFKSTDGGASWSQMSNGLPYPGVRSLAIDPKNTNVIYAGTDEGVFKSTDGGAFWSTINNGLYEDKVESLVIDPKNTNIIYVGTDHGVFKSTDGGAFWSAINNGLQFCIGVPSLAIDPKNTNIIYAGTENEYSIRHSGIFKSTNGGAFWSVINNRLSFEGVSSLAIDPKNTNIIYAGIYGDTVFKSTNGGASWSRIGTGVRHCWIYSLAIDPTNTQVIYAGTDEGVFKSTDGGAFWSAINNGLIGWESTSVRSLAIDPKNTNIIYAGIYDTVFKSTNGGASWSLIGTGLTHSWIYSLAIDPKNTNTIYVGMGNRAFKLTDGGSSWSQINNGLPNGLPYTDVRSLAIDPKNTNIIYAGTDEGVFKSADGGSSWSAINNGLTNRNIRSLVIDLQNPNILYAGTWGGGVFKLVTSGIVTPATVTIVSTDPSNGANNVPVDKTITITFSKDVQPGTTYNAISLKDANGNTITVTKSVTGKVLTIKPKTTLSYDTKYTVAIPADAVSDMAQAYTFSFTTAKKQNEEELINALAELKEAMLKKIDDDVDVTATTFANVKDYWRSKRWADLVRAPLGILEDTLALPLKVKDFAELQKETNEKIREAGDLYHVLSLMMMLNDLQKIGGKLATAIDGPSYSTAVTKMLDAADATYVPPIDLNWKEYYKKVIVNDLQGVGDEKPLAIQQKSTTSERETIAVAHGVLEVRTNISKNFNDLIDIIKKDGLPSNFPLEKTVNWLKELKKEVVSSKLQDIDVEYNLLINGKTWHTKIKIGTVADWYKTFGNIAGILDKNLGIEQKVELLKAGEAVICAIRYSTTGAVEEDLGILQSIVKVGEISLEAQEKSFHSDPETEFYMVPQEMLMALPAELSDTWVIADDVNQQIRAYLQAKKIITLKIGSSNMIVNDISQGIDAQGSTPIIKNGRTLVPIRAIIESLGGTVVWNATERKVTISLGSTTIELWIGKSTAKVNGVGTSIDSMNAKVVPEIINGRTMLPLRFVAENLGCDVQWDGITKTITITYQGGS